MDAETLRAAALRYRAQGLCVLPARAERKHPALPRWGQYQKQLPDVHEVVQWFERPQDGLCLVCGAVSGNLEMLDFDLGGEAFQPWYEHVKTALPGLLERLVIEQSPSGGWHVAYRCAAPICGNMKLAQKKLSVSSPDEATIAGKRYVPRAEESGGWSVLLTLIETRGEGGLFLCAPTPGYELLQGDFAQLPVLAAAEREKLLEAAWSLNEERPAAVDNRSISAAASGLPENAVDGRPGDDFNHRGDVRAVLRRHGWTLAKVGDNEYWRRPGKASGSSATLKDDVFYVFSSSAPPFEPNCPYSPFGVYALLEHGGDFIGAASALRAEGYGSIGDRAGSDVDLSRLIPCHAA